MGFNSLTQFGKGSIVVVGDELFKPKASFVIKFGRLTARVRKRISGIGFALTADEVTNKRGREAE